MLFNRPVSGQIIDLHIILLSKPVNASNPLLYTHRIPGQIEIDHVMAELKIYPLAPRLCSNHDLGTASEQIHHPVFLAAVHPAPVRNGS
ncbi:hypothetical protein D3C85_1470900 [compost metagenome]